VCGDENSATASKPVLLWRPSNLVDSGTAAKEVNALPDFIGISSNESIKAAQHYFASMHPECHNKQRFLACHAVPSFSKRVTGTLFRIARLVRRCGMALYGSRPRILGLAGNLRGLPCLSAERRISSSASRRTLQHGYCTNAMVKTLFQNNLNGKTSYFFNPKQHADDKHILCPIRNGSMLASI
jgi:hypothetical protein